MGGEDVELLERVAIDQPGYALARGQLAFRVLPVERLGISVAGFVFALAQLVKRVDLLGFGFSHSPANQSMAAFPSSSAIVGTTKVMLSSPLSSGDL
jgi:hypothetical protein